MRNGLSYAEAGRLGQIVSRSTQEKQQKAKEEAYLLNPSRCGCCNLSLPYKKKRNRFCSSSCAAKVNKNGSKRQKRPLGTCLNCGTTKKRSISKYCCLGCQHEYEYGLFIEKWLKGEVDGGRGKYHELISNHVRRWLLEKSGGCCDICGLKEWMNKPMPLLSDHIDGHSANNRPENLRVVCGNCDMQLNTYKGKNAGNGRRYRRERYANGQSY
jgi:hypothetical protein